MTHTVKSAKVGRIVHVRPHPESNSLDIVTVKIHPEGSRIFNQSWTNVANRREDGSPRYSVGDFAVVLVENLILPDNLIKHLDMWNDAKNRGGLAGSKGNRTKARKVAGVLSEVALCAIEWVRGPDETVAHSPGYVLQHGAVTVDLDVPVVKMVTRVVDLNDPQTISPEGLDLTTELGITLHGNDSQVFPSDKTLFRGSKSHLIDVAEKFFT